MALGDSPHLLVPAIKAGEDLDRGIFVKLNTSGAAVK